MLDNQKSTLYFVEQFSSQSRDVINGKIIALTPAACYQLDRDGKPYQIYEDFYDMAERKEYSKEYNQRKVSWINDFDEYLRNKLTDSLDKEINFVRLYGYYIDAMADSFVIGSKNILSVLEKEKPSKVFLVTADNLRNGFNWRLFNIRIDMSTYLLPIICEKMDISYSVINVNSQESKDSSIIFKLKNFLRRVFKTLIRIIDGLYIQSIYLLLWSKRKKLKKEGKFKTAIITSEDWLDNLYKKAVKTGYRILYHTMRGPKSYLFFRKRNEDEIRNFYIDEMTACLWTNIGEAAIKEFNPSRWVSSEAGIDLSRILDQRFLYFLQKICPVISLSAKQYKKIFSETKIDYVVCQYKTFPSDFGLMAAATLHPNVLSVHVEHGSGEIERHLRYFTELPANIYITSSREAAVFYNKWFNSGEWGKVEVKAGRVWIDKYKHEAEKIKNRAKKCKKNSRLNIYYLPAVQNIQRFACSYPFCWYYRLQRDLYKHFSQLLEYNFFIKGHSGGKWISKPISAFLNDLKAPNIFYREGDLLSNLRRADKVITDLPSSPTHEARLMGLPVLSLYHESLNVRDTARGAYGKTLALFRTKEEMFSYIDIFLSSSLKEYIVPMDDNFAALTLLDIFERVNNRKSNIPEHGETVNV